MATLKKPKTKAATTKKAAKPKAVEPKAAEPKATAVDAKEPLKKKELIDAVEMSAGLKRSEAKAAVEAMMRTLSGAFGEGRGVQSPELGSIKIKREKEGASGPVYIARIKPSSAPKTPRLVSPKPAE